MEEVKRQIAHIKSQIASLNSQVTQLQSSLKELKQVCASLGHELVPIYSDDKYLLNYRGEI
jgi:prefoldin subunit 5